ncbi:dipeptide ABC transporter ATP-binding protein [uncultured Roseobacter sp.]|uniref:ABC transporter ATP-binding protein n=1 Tax=uncultured Roseobacter sp. TaxID=114847 RepID=UPI0026291186|nr:dipeptide ABC transporter ATP-binding protein [uncultured Roseobacter sp.]
MSGTPILEARALKRHFVTRKPLFGAPTVVRAVDGVDLAIAEGETFAIVGESGCGKSTLARLLVRLIEPSDGRVAYQGKDIGDLSEQALRALRAELQFIFQDPFSSLNPRMTVGALIEEPLRTHEIGTAEERRSAVARILTRVGLRPEHADRYPHEFSGGQRQRIGIARALVSGPKVVIGDEPVSALDVSIQAQVINILEDLKEAFGLTLIVIAHDLAVIRHMSDRVAVMYLGRIVEIGTADRLFQAPAHPYTEALLEAIPIPSVGARKAHVAIEGDPPNPIAPPSGCRFHTRCPYAADICRTEAPTLRDVGDGHQAACHFSGDLALKGIQPDDVQRTPAATRRFEIYSAARAQADPITHQDPSNREETPHAYR